MNTNRVRTRVADHASRDQPEAMIRQQPYLALLLLCAWPGVGLAQVASPGSVVAWGGNWAGESEVPVAARAGVTAIAAGSAHIVALKADGTVVAWGWYYDEGRTVPVAAQTGVRAIAAGGECNGFSSCSLFTVALKTDGTVVAWGSNYGGETTVPEDLSGVRAIAAGLWHTVALRSDGSVVAWGSNDQGQATVPVAAQSGVTAIAAGHFHTLALKANGSVLAWGNNSHGQTTVPEGLSGATAIAAGYDCSVALLGTAVSLEATRGRGELVLSWPVDLVGFTLQATPSLSPAVAWRDSTNAPVLQGARFAVTNGTLGGAQFYRLRRP